jgi:hypothetical protein
MIDNFEEKKKRPVFLVVLAVLSFITIGFSLISVLFGLISGPLSSDSIEAILAENMPLIDQMQELGAHYWADEMLKAIKIIEYTNANFWVNQIISLLTYVAGGLGVVFMLKGQKRGFHLYIIYNLLALFGVYASVPMQEVPSFVTVFNAIISVLFIFLYSRNIHFLK